ncbi:MAG TPA: amino acid ABC transporter permease, partial [Solimonas sp.]|nr:amino acid ABC transporter permease [Solimonas sp.]
MHASSRRWWWYGVYVAVVAAFGVAVYAAGQRVDYSWRWQRIPQYLVSNDGVELNAPFDGFVSIANDQKSLTLKELRGGRTQTLSGFDELLVGDGDLVFQNDPLARKRGLVAGPLTIGLWMTLKISALALVFSMLFGLVAGLGRIAKNPAVYGLATTYVEL